MSISLLRDVVHAGNLDSWKNRNTEAFQALFGSAGGRYSIGAGKTVTLRAPEIAADTGVPFAAYIHPSNPSSGAYSGLSFVIFPVPDKPALIGLVVGTQGLSPDEAILGRPGHARKVQAICSWLNQKYGGGEVVAWAKHDPTRTDLQVPDQVGKQWSEYKSVFDRYGKEMYAVFRPTDNQAATEDALKAFVDLLFEERGHVPIAGSLASYEEIRKNWFEHLMPGVERKQVQDLLSNRRFVIVQGPPGTGRRVWR